MSRLVEAIGAATPLLAERVVEEMYQDPFWLERFGERGRRYALEDGRHHLSYLCQALEAGDAEPLMRYALWLRSVLTSRGICSRHLAENFLRLARALDEQVTDAAPASALLRQAASALTHEQGVAGELDGWAQRAGDNGEWAYHLSYLADALAAERPELFLEHSRFLAGSPRRAERNVALLDLFRRMEERITGAGLSPRCCQSVKAMLDVARQDLQERP